MRGLARQVLSRVRPGAPVANSCLHAPAEQRWALGGEGCSM